MRAGLLVVLTVAWLLGGAGCVKGPDRIEVKVGGSSRPEPVDSSRVPDTATHEQARAELVKAYQNLQCLERENAELARKLANCKRELDQCQDRLERYKD